MVADDETIVPAARRMDAASLVAGLVTVTLWGSAFVAIRDAGEAMAPGALALGRVLVSSAILRAIALARREPLPSRRDLAVIGAFGTLWLGVYSVALNEAERHVDAGAAAMLVGSGPLLIALLAGIFLREGFPRRLFSGCAIAFVGSSIIGFATSQAGSNVALGIALLFIAVLARVSAFQVTWLGCAAATLALLPFAPSLIQDMQSAGETAIGLTIYLGIFPTAIGFATWSFALRRTSAGQMGAMLYLIPIVAVLLSWAILSEMPPWLAVAGGALSLGGVYLARRD